MGPYVDRAPGRRIPRVSRTRHHPPPEGHPPVLPITQDDEGTGNGGKRDDGLGDNF
jgi:hypothetical protein